MSEPGQPGGPRRWVGRLRQVTAGLAGAAAMIAVVTAASRVVGFVRTLVMASEVGPNDFGTAYAAANTLPNVLFEVAAGGALAGAVVPLVALPLARSMRGDVDRTASALLGWTLAFTVPLAALVAVFSRPLVGFALPDATPDQLDLAGSFLVMFSPQIPLYGLGLVLTGVLQAHRRFLWPALAPLLNSLVVIAVFLAFGRLVPDKTDLAAVPGGAVALLGWGTTAGVAMMSLPLLGPVHRLGVRLRLGLRFPEGAASRARALAAAGLGALVAQQVSVLVVLRVAGAYGEDGTYPAYQFTQAVYFLPYAVLAYPLATATLPRLAERAARGDGPGFARLASTTTRAVLVVAALGAAALAAAAPWVERVFAVVADGDVTGMGRALTWMAPGLLGFALILHLSRALYALDRGRSAVLAAAAGWLVVAATALLLVPWLTGGARDQVATLSGLGAASSLGMSVAGVALVIGLVAGAGGSAAAGVPRTAAVLVLAGTLGAAAGRFVSDAASGLGPLAAAPEAAVAVVVGVLGALVAAAIVLLAVRLLDREAVAALLAGRRPPASPPDAPVVEN